MKISIQFLVTAVILLGCGPIIDDHTLVVGNGMHVKATLILEETESIKKITFSSTYSDHKITIPKGQLSGKNKIVYQFTNPGEGTFKTCVITTQDTFCLNDYVEKGYRPKMRFVRDSLVWVSAGFSGVGF